MTGPRHELVKGSKVMNNVRVSIKVTVTMDAGGVSLHVNTTA